MLRLLQVYLKNDHEGVWGSYHVLAKPTIFMADSWNESEHDAAEAHRKGARIGFYNELGNADWSNGDCKRRNGMDPSTVRACGVGAVNVVKPTMTHTFATNDPPKLWNFMKGLLTVRCG